MGKKSHANSSKLRLVLKQDKTCVQLFEEAEALAKGIFRGGHCVPLPFYTEHGEEHCKAVESFLDHIIWKNGEAEIDEKHDFIPSAEEAMYILSAVWLHDIGMWYGIFGKERAEQIRSKQRVIKLRERHEFRTSQYIQEEWTADCTWSRIEKEWLANICVYHRGHHPMSSFEPVKESGRYGADHVRLGVLAALLRLADACHVDNSRSPQPVMRLYVSLGMHREARGHWERADLIQDVRFEHDERRIVVRGHYPQRVNFGLGAFDVREVGEMICDNIRRELRGVQQTLSHFSNTDFRDVRHSTYRMRSKDYQQKRQCLHLWPYLLNRPFSASEAAAALAKMLLLSAENAEESGDLGKEWRKDMRQIMKKTKGLRKQNFMIRNLCIAVEKLLSLSELPEDGKSAIKLREYLMEFMRSIEENCGSMVVHALKEIGPDDVLVLSGHSVNIERLLRNVDESHSLYIVNCYKPLDVHEVFDENKKIIDLVKNLGFTKYKFLQLESLAAALRELKGKRPCKVFLGTNGRLKKGDLLCEVGSYIIASTAKRFGAEVVAFCEKTKFLANSVKDDEIAGHEKIFSSEHEKMHPELVNVPYVAPKVDRVPKNLVDMVVTEAGVERRKPAKRGAGTGKGHSRRRKASKAK